MHRHHRLEALVKGLEENRTLTSLSLFQNRTLGPDVGQALAAVLVGGGGAQLVLLNLLCTGQDAGSVAALVHARAATAAVPPYSSSLPSNSTSKTTTRLRTLCGIDPEEEEMSDLSDGSLSGIGLLAADALLLAADIAHNMTLTALNVRENDLGEEGRAALKNAAAGRATAVPLRLEMN